MTSKLKYIKTFGCSLTEGWDVFDKNNIWPNLLAQKLKLKLINYGYGSASNQGIINQVLQNFDKNSLHVIAFTSPFRFHVVDKFSNHWDLNLTTPKKKWLEKKVAAKNTNKEYMGTKEYRIIEAFKPFIDSNYFYQNFLQQIIFLQTILNKNNFSYVFVYANSMGVKFNWSTQSQLPDEPFHPKKYFNLSNCVKKKYFIDFDQPQNSFWERTITKKFPIGPTRHPLEDAHKNWALHLSNKIKEIL